jgi:hypothetical protein
MLAAGLERGAAVRGEFPISIARRRVAQAVTTDAADLSLTNWGFIGSLLLNRHLQRRIPIRAKKLYNKLERDG